MHTIAFPALGTGRQRFPPDVAASLMVRAMKEFVKSNKVSSLEAVHIIVHPTEARVLTAFKESTGIDNVKVLCNERSPYGASLPRGSPSKLQTNLWKGNIENIRCDVIVNSTSKDLNLDIGGISGAILQAGGNILQVQCRQNYPDGIAVGSFAETTGGSLQCKVVYHTTNESWSGPACQSEQVLQNIIVKCLKAANTNGMQTIAFPAMGTGGQQFPPEVAASLMVKAIQEFEKSNKVSSLEAVHIVVHPANEKVVQAFKLCTGIDRLKIVRSERTQHNASLPSGSQSKLQTYLWKGHIENIKCDVIVNSTSQSSNLDIGGISSAILKAGGNTLQEQILQNYPDGIKVGSFAETTGGSLQCKVVYHTTNDNWSGPSCQSEQVLQNVIIKCLKAANKNGMRTIAFPAMGAGGQRFPPDVASSLMVKAIQEFINSNKISSLEAVHIVLYPGNDSVLRAFKECTGIDSLNVLRNERTPYGASLPSRCDLVFSGSGHQHNATPGTIVPSLGHTRNLPAPRVWNTSYIGASGIQSVSISFPTNWDAMNANDIVKVLLKSSGSDYTDICVRFFTSSSSGLTVKKIERIQNLSLYAQYTSKMKYMTTQREKHLWHGTDPSVTDKINARGFDRNLSGKHATRYGHGSYFAVNASYSERFAPANGSGERCMYLCKVLTGDFTAGKSSMKAPPPKSNNNPMITYDSVVDDVKSPTIYVVFADAQAYPEYLVTFG